MVKQDQSRIKTPSLPHFYSLKDSNLGNRPEDHKDQETKIVG